MVAIDRPNRDILDRAIGIYRDSMREFIVRCLKQAPGLTLEKAVEDALSVRRNTGRLNAFRSHLNRGGELKGFIDVGDFPGLIGHHWDSVFSDAFKDDRQNVMLHCQFAASGRHREAHPDTGDIGPAETRAYLYHITEMMSSINHFGERGRVEELSRRIPDPDVVNLEAVVGELAIKLNDTIERLERLDSDADQDWAEILDGLREQFRVQDDRFRDEVTLLIKTGLAELREQIDRQAEIISEIISEMRTVKTQDTDDLQGTEELARTSDVENVRRLTVELRSENADLRDRIEVLTAQVSEIQSGTQAIDETADWVDDRDDNQLQDVEEDEDEDDDEETKDGRVNEDEGDLGLDSLFGRLAAALSRMDTGVARGSAPLPGIWSGARFYCTMQDCMFSDGSRRAWWHEWKALNHMHSTGHKIAEV